jgi:DNA end-binding protein Ku
LVGQEAFAVIRDAMAETDLVGMGRIILSNRERPIIIEPMGRGLRGITLHYEHEVRNEAEYFADIPNLALPDEMLDVAKHILKTKAAEFDPVVLEDRYRTALALMLTFAARRLRSCRRSPRDCGGGVLGRSTARKQKTGSGR